VSFERSFRPARGEKLYSRCCRAGGALDRVDRESRIRYRARPHFESGIARPQARPRRQAIPSPALKL
jgi:hypothetical protein